MIRQFTLFSALVCSSGCAQAQVPDDFPKEFPAGAETPSASVLAERLRSQVYTGKPVKGPGWRAEYQSTGYVFVDVSNGARDSDKWRTEEGRVCAEYVGRFPSGCSEIRISGDRLFVKSRSTGEVIAMEKK